jgi:predicted TIM-barrel fold metal-dependent hydrolase
VFDRHPNLRVIVPHAGAALPLLTSRIDGIGGMVTGKEQPMRKALRRLHFDVAGLPVPEMLPALRNVADPTHIHYGSDWPFTPLPRVQSLAAQLDMVPGLGAGWPDTALRQNSQALLG